MSIYTIEIQNNQDEVLVKELLTRLGIKIAKVQNSIKSNTLDETDYLFSSEKNKKRLLKSLENADKGENLTEISLDDFKKQFLV